MTTQEQAEYIIRDIRRARHADDPGGIENDANAQDLVQALSLLSDQLYDKPTHFILELVQNADDNIYPEDVDPCLSFEYHAGGYLFISCTEVGFSEANVRAVCSVGHSTKKTLPSESRKGYIGEKGIGFKAVFKVADVVYISSGHFNFKFDKNRPLGMVVPELSSLPKLSPSFANTTICLRIPDIQDRRAIEQDLKDLRAELLLFLRKLRVVDVKILSSSKGGRQVQHHHIVRCRDDEAADGVSTLSSSELVGRHRTTEEKIYCSSIECTNMPFEVKRDGIRTTDLVLGFPLLPNSPRQRYVYNFLPIRGHGLAFLLHADFILTADRSNIIEGNAWNKELKQRVVEAFGFAIDELNDSGLCKYNWPGYLSGSSRAVAQGTILNNLVDDIIETLRTQAVLETQIGTVARPVDVCSVPRHFTDGCNPPKPLLSVPALLKTFVSPQYDAKDLQILAVRPQSTLSFHNALKSMGLAWIRGRASTWHSRLAAGILKAGPARFRDIPLIPLRDGSWIPSTDAPFYLPANNHDIAVPSGIDAKVIDEEACADLSRKRLFVELGAKSLTVSEICRLLLRFHDNLLRCHLSRADLIAHAWFIYTHGSVREDCRRMYFATEKQDEAMRAEDLYLDVVVGHFRMKEYFDHPYAPCHFVHSDYGMRVGTSQAKSWHNWLQGNAGMSTLPRLRSAQGHGMSRVFKHLIEHCPSRTWLELLRNHWTTYRVEALSVSGIRQILVDCKGMQRYALKETYLPTTEINGETLDDKFTALLDVQNPDDPGWRNLAGLGIHMEPDLHFYLSMLTKATRSTTPADIGSERLSRIYSGIDRYFHTNPSRAKVTFANEAVIGLPTRRQIEWLSLSQCRWDAPSCLTRVLSVKDHLRNHKALFREKLGLRSADAADVLDELLQDHFKVSGDATKTLLLLLTEQKNLDHRSLDERFRKLRRRAIFPVRKGGSELSTRCMEDNDWFISDRQRLADCFEAKVWILDFNGEETQKMQPLLQRSNLLNKCLTMHAKEFTVTGGSEVFAARQTHILQAKAEYISRLVSPESSREAALSQLQRIQVWSSSNLVLRRSITIGDREVFGESEQGRVLLQVSGECLRVLCPEKSIASNDLPWCFVAEKLLEYFRIAEKWKPLLITVLGTLDHDVISDVLERQGLQEHHSGRDRQGRQDTEPQDSDDEESAQARSMTHITAVRREISPGSDYDGDVAHVTASLARENRRTRLSGPRFPPAQVFDPGRIAAAAAAAARPYGKVDIIAPGTGQSPSPDVALPQATGPGSAVSTRRSHSNLVGGAPASRKDSAFNMRTLQDSLLEFDTLEVEERSEIGTVASIEHEIGYGGELFIYHFLRKKDIIDQSCWTSNMRSRFGLPAFNGFEGSYSDFTIPGSGAHAAFLGAWLARQRLQVIGEWCNGSSTYHVEVKTTIGGLTEPFMMSNNQMNLARSWHAAPDHVYMIFRVYHLKSDPEFQIYVDPYALMQQGKLAFSAQGGYCVQPT